MNDTLLYVLIWFAKMRFPVIGLKVPAATMIAQARLETANYTSKSFTDAKNIFGMKKPSKRKFWGTGEMYGHAKYASHWHSVLDYFERVQAYKETLGKSTDYYDFLLDSKYAEDTKYISKLKAIESKLTLPNAATLGLSVVLFFILYKLVIKK